MKYVFWGIACILFVASCTKCKPDCIVKSHLSFSNLKGNVKTLKTRTYVAIEKFGEITKGKIDQSYEVSEDNQFLSFDELGMFSKAEYYDTLGKLTRKEVSSINKVGCVCEIKVFDFDTLSWSDKIEYFEDNTIETKRYNSIGKLQRVSKSKFDKNGNEIETNNFTPDGTLLGKTKSEYNEQGDFVKLLSYDKEGKQTSESTYKYDYTNNTREYTNSSGDIYSQFEKRNENKDVIETHFLKMNSNYTYEYEYDKKGNWTQKIKYSDGKPKYITERRIEYY